MNETEDNRSMAEIKAENRKLREKVRCRDARLKQVRSELEQVKRQRDDYKKSDRELRHLRTPKHLQTDRELILRDKKEERYNSWNIA